MSCVWTVLVESYYAEINFGICYFAVWWFVYSFVFKEKLIVLQAHFAAYVIKCCQCGIDYKKGEQLNYVCEILQWKLIAQLLYYISKFWHVQQIRNYVFYVEEERGVELICTFLEVCVKICLYIMKKKSKIKFQMASYQN